MPLAEWAKARNSIFPTLVCESLEKGRTQQLACQWEKRKAVLYFKGSLWEALPHLSTKETWREAEERPEGRGKRKLFFSLAAAEWKPTMGFTELIRVLSSCFIMCVSSERAVFLTSSWNTHVAQPLWVLTQPCIKLLFNQLTKLGGAFCFCSASLSLGQIQFPLGKRGSLDK